MNQTQIKNYYKSDIFHLNEEKKIFQKNQLELENVCMNPGRNLKKKLGLKKK